MKTNLYRELQRMDISYAINEIVDLTLPRDTQNKILMVNIRFQIDDFGNDFSTNKFLTLIYYRPNSYTFVGRIKHDYLNSESEIEYLSYHDSCWRQWRQDGTSSTISKFAEEIEKEIESKSKDFSIFTTFETHFVEGNLDIHKSTDNSVKFIKP